MLDPNASKKNKQTIKPHNQLNIIFDINFLMKKLTNFF